ncbi:MAG: BrnT family toxin [Luteibacter sp.]
MLAFEWHDAKASSNEIKHGVAFEVACTALLDIHALHLGHHRVGFEDRFRIVGVVGSQKILCIVYTIRGSKLRLISARGATRHEEKTYWDRVLHHHR